MTQPTILIWGAGRIGRGFCGDLFADAGYHLVLVDQAPALVEALRVRRRYTVVRTTGTARQDRVIDGLDVLSTAQATAVEAALAAADLIAVAVFPRDFPAVARQMVPGLLRRHDERPAVPLDVILCTNLAHAGPAFREPLLAALPPGCRAWAEAQIGIVESLVIRMVADPPPEELARDPLLVWTNGYAGFPVDGRAFKGPLPALPGLRAVDDMRLEEQRKLYTYNTFHAALAYLGALRGHVRIVDCLADPWVTSAARAALGEAGAALTATYGLPDEEMCRWMEGVIDQTDNPALGDTVARFGADPGRKLRRDDRLVGPLLLARRRGIETPGLIRALAAALRYQDADDAGAILVREKVETLGVEEAARVLCGLNPDEADLVQAIAHAYHHLPLEIE